MIATDLTPSAGAVEGVLVIIPPPTNGHSPVSASTVVAGVPLLRRIVLAGERAGFARIFPLESREAVTGPARIVLAPANVVPQPHWLRSLREMAIGRDKLYIDPSFVAMIETDDPGRIISLADDCQSAEDLIGRLREAFELVAGSFDPGGRFPVETHRDVAGAEAWLLRGLIKPNEGFMSRHVERRVSLALTRRLMGTGLTPNTMTLVSVAIGLMAAPFFLSSLPALQLTGACLLLAHSILDGSDGELARLKFLESRRGAVLDFWGDNVVHVAVFACIAIGWSIRSMTVWPLVLGAVAVGSTLGSAAALSHRFVGATVPADAGALRARLIDWLAHRDFIYLLIALSAFGKTAWFLALVSAGTPIFLAMLLWSGRARRPGS